MDELIEQVLDDADLENDKSTPLVQGRSLGNLMPVQVNLVIVAKK
jgi:hypothetical protein